MNLRSSTQVSARRALTGLGLSATLVLCLSATLALGACGERAAADLTIERLPDVTPSVPSVPTLPPPPYPVQYPDNSYTVYGLRRRASTTMDSAVDVTGYIVAIYAAPECPEGRTCPPPAAPHMWIADAASAGPDDDRLMVAGYAENQAAITEAVEQAQHGRYHPPDPELGILPIPVDFQVGAKVKVSGRFTRVSGAGFNVSNGMLDYTGSQIVEPAAGQTLLMPTGAEAAPQ